MKQKKLHSIHASCLKNVKTIKTRRKSPVNLKRAVVLPKTSKRIMKIQQHPKMKSLTQRNLSKFMTGGTYTKRSKSISLQYADIKPL